VDRLGLSVRSLRSWTGLVFASLYALVFVVLYVGYLRRAGTWFADLPLVLAALPFTLVMRALNGGTYDFAGDMTLRVIAGALFCCALAYLAGLVVEAAIRALVRIGRAPAK
jgi:hypothetical protein